MIGDSPEWVRLDVLGNPVKEWGEGGNEDHWMSLPVGWRSRLSVTSQLLFSVGAVVSSLLVLLLLPSYCISRVLYRPEFFPPLPSLFPPKMETFSCMYPAKY